MHDEELRRTRKNERTRRMSACRKIKISTWAAEQCQRPSMPPWLPSSHIVAVLCPHTLLQKIQQLVCYFHNWKSHSLHAHASSIKTRHAPLVCILFKHIYTDAQAYNNRLKLADWWRDPDEREERSSTTADGEIDSYTACINSLSLKLNYRGREGEKRGRRGEEGEWWVNMERYGGSESKGVKGMKKSEWGRRSRR